jgi:hypothetical protein
VEDEFHLVCECDAYMDVRELFWRLFADVGDWISPVDNPCGRDMARFMQQSQPHVAAFIHYCFLVRDDPVMVGSILPLVLSDTESETDSYELVEVSS